jgi:hypothetical protein
MRGMETVWEAMGVIQGRFVYYSIQTIFKWASNGKVRDHPNLCSWRPYRK